MCGIAGILAFNQQPVRPEILEAMSNAIAHRGPDDNGLWTNGTIGFVHQRLSIIDTSSNAHQPMHSADGRFTVVYNGELFNHNEFRSELKAKGFTFHSSSDTEVLLYLYMSYGPSMLHRLNGMFSFAIWDNQKQELFVCRDRVGVKPFYYFKDNKQFCFASEPKAIFASGIRAQINTENINEWLTYRYVAGDQTLLHNIQKLLPGHYAYIKPNGEYKQYRWWNLSEQTRKHTNIEKPFEWFEQTFHDAVKTRMIADVPVGVMLSGGIDSSSIAASLKHSNFEHIHTFNVGFTDYKYDESAIAKRYSESLNFPFHGITVEKTNLFQSVVKSTLSYDEPLVHLNDPQILSLASVAKNHVKVLLSGEGADEFLGGYVRYKVFRYLKHQNIIKALLSVTPDRFKNTRIKKLERYIAHGSINELIKSNGANYFETDFKDLNLPYLNITNTYRDDIIKEASQLYPSDISRQLLYYDQHTYLQSLNDRNDRATMGASVECRDPFMDYRLMEGLGTLNKKYLLKGTKGKYILMETMKKYLPEYILNHQKVGFSVPWNTLIHDSEELSFEYQEFLTSDVFEMVGLAKESVKKLLSDANNHPYEQLRLQLFFMYIWKKYYLTSYS